MAKDSLLTLPSSISLLGHCFVDLCEGGKWTEAYLVQPGAVQSFLVSALSPEGNLFFNLTLAPFRTKLPRPLLDNQAFCVAICTLPDLFLSNEISSFFERAHDCTEEAYVQMYAGYLPMQFYLNHDLTEYQTALCCFFDRVDFLTSETLTRVWPSVCACELLLFNPFPLQYKRLLVCHLRAISKTNSPFAIVNSFPMVSKWISAICCQSSRERNWDDWEVYGQAAEAYITHCIQTAHFEDAIQTLSIAVECARKRINSPKWLFATLPYLSPYFDDFPEHAGAQAHVLQYLLSEDLVTAADIVESRLLSVRTATLLCSQAAATLVHWAVSHSDFRSYLADCVPNFPIFSSKALERLLNSLNEDDEYKLCRALRCRPVLVPLEGRTQVQRVLLVLRHEAIWIALKALRLPKSLIRNLVVEMLD